ncbi:MAG: peptide-methionine (S)-S-oxide reductase MsrA, partial [Deltaproteobacteria bacterium]|nr:peptide-methionine (S)-S-oxide reductase MsrA [Deltaproteobacteria bacterium]MBW2534528.1 peptide-methionine (S)-S-oxide reductase MsrA [Deltaproteobacteria bacterium]
MLFRPIDLPLPSEEQALPGRDEPMRVPATHAVLGSALHGDFPAERLALFGMGCFWGAEKIFWQLDGVTSTAVGYAGGYTPNPSYREVCSGRTGHTEVVRVVFDPGLVTYGELLRRFWEGHDPTQGMRQGADVGTQYRSAIFTYSDEQQREALRSLAAYQRALADAGLGAITTEVGPAPSFYFAEPYHQQYLAKNPAGYCGHGGPG